MAAWRDGMLTQSLKTGKKINSYFLAANWPTFGRGGGGCVKRNSLKDEYESLMEKGNDKLSVGWFGRRQL